MTEKELFSNALKNNLHDPTELSDEEILTARKRGAVVRTSYAKYIAAAAAAALVIGGSVFVFGRGVKTSPQADDISSTAAASIAAQEHTSELSADEAEILYIDLWRIFQNSSNNYYAHAIRNETENGITTYRAALIENRFKASESEAVRTASEFFGSASSIEYLGHRKTSDETDGKLCVEKTVDDTVYELFVNGPASMISFYPREGLKTTEYGCSYLISGKSAYVLLNVPSESGAGYTNYYYKVTSADGKYPLFDGEKCSISSWETNESNRSYVMDPDELKAQNGSETFTALDTEKRIGFEFTVDFKTDGIPEFDITKLILPEGVDITNGKFVIQLDTNEKIAVNRTAEIKIGKIDMSDLSLDIDPKKIVSVSLKAVFDTTEHATAGEYKRGKANDDSTWEYAYSISAFLADGAAARANSPTLAAWIEPFIPS